MSGEGSSRSRGKRPLPEDNDDSAKNPPAKRVRFPKGKKGKPVEVIVEKVIAEEDVNDLSNPAVAAKERVKRRNQITAELISDENGGISKVAEVTYKENENFVEDGIQIEPFNLDKEREEGYFDASGNFVEYVRDNEIKDAWLDNVEVDPRYAGLSSVATNDEEEVQELSSKDVAIMKRRIANVLEPEETVLQGLRRLKGSGDRKTKMSGETKIVFDQLTEDAMKLMENGEFNVYHEHKEVFEREADGYEKLVRAREEGISGNTDDFDMFAVDDGQAATKPSTDENNAVSEPLSDAINSSTEDEAALILIRHGESLWNEKNLFTGCVDVSLSKKGIDEAIEAGKRISSIPVDLIFTSALIRAQMTAMLAMTQHRRKKVPIVMHNESEQAKAWSQVFSEDTKKQSIPVIAAWQLNERM